MYCHRMHGSWCGVAAIPGGEFYFQQVQTRQKGLCEQGPSGNSALLLQIEGWYMRPATPSIKKNKIQRNWCNKNSKCHERVGKSTRKQDPRGLLMEACNKKSARKLDPRGLLMKACNKKSTTRQQNPGNQIDSLMSLDLRLNQLLKSHDYVQLARVYSEECQKAHDKSICLFDKPRYTGIGGVFVRFLTRPMRRKDRSRSQPWQG